MTENVNIASVHTENEIERKWLVKNPLPFIEKKMRGHGRESDHLHIEQAYLSFDPEIRIRRAIEPITEDVVYVKQSLKSDGDIARKEIEFDIDPAVYDSLILNFVDHAGIINKDYYKFPVDAGFMTITKQRIPVSTEEKLFYEISKVDNGWWYMEIEFKNEKVAKAFELDPELVEAMEPIEVTENKIFKMKNYAKARINKIHGNKERAQYASYGVNL